MAFYRKNDALTKSQLRIVDKNDNEVEIGETGHIQVKGDNIFLGYWKKDDKSHESFTADGFFRTGDLGVFNKSHYVSIIGRAKDMIITGGLNVYPKEIETYLNKINGVIESAVIGLPHPDFGEAVTAVIVKNDGAKIQGNDIIAAMKEKLANYKAPKKVVFVKSLPRNAMGKVQKNILRDHYNSLFSLSL